MRILIQCLDIIFSESGRNGALFFEFGGKEYILIHIFRRLLKICKVVGQNPKEQRSISKQNQIDWQKGTNRQEISNIRGKLTRKKC